MNVLPRLYKSRHGIYYFRLTQNKKKVRWQLRSTDSERFILHELRDVQQAFGPATYCKYVSREPGSYADKQPHMDR